MADRCRTCRAGLDHCHGTLVHHPVGATDCTEDGCPGAGIVPHDFAVDCDAVGCHCCAERSPAVAV